MGRAVGAIGAGCSGAGGRKAKKVFHRAAGC